MKRFNIVQNGYDIDEVNKFIDIVIKRLEQLDGDVKKYQKESIDLRSQLNESKIDDENIRKALIMIEQTNQRVTNQAKAEANLIIDEAKKNASSIVHEALLQANNYQKEAIMLKKNITVYKMRIKSLLEAQLDIADELDKIEL